MNTVDIRKSFLEFFKSKGHEIVASSSLVPDKDPTILFTNAGMNQFKNVFLGGEKRGYTRATTCQKVMRISGKHNDLENVGASKRHHTFFEMLGNFSFGDYFKADAIKFGWELSTKVLGLPKERLWVTVFENDDEAAKLWAENTDILPGRILRMGEKDNFWTMGETGPCGPCSEIFYFGGSDVSKQSEEDFRRDDGTYLEFWNLVFMQFDRAKDGTLTPLPRPSIDTGMGLERMAMILQGVASNYDTNEIRPIISLCEQLSGFKYQGNWGDQRDLKDDLDYARDVAMRVIADHARAVSFLVCDGVLPGSDGRGYVLRRVMRRAIRHGKVLAFKEPFLAKACDQVISSMKSSYPELEERRDHILKVADNEERKFHETLDSGLAILQKEVEKISKGSLFPGNTAFVLHDTYGFPLDLTEDALKPYGVKVDSVGFEKAMDEQRTRSREDRKSRGLAFSSVKIDAEKTKFLGYQETQAQASLLQSYGTDGKELSKSGAGTAVSLVFDASPFYAESGGQVGDIGIIEFPEARLRVVDTQKSGSGHILHECEVVEGEFSSGFRGMRASLQVDAVRRNKIRSNHSTTHLVHSALRKVLGAHVKQAGSRVDDSTLRFDYSHFETVSESQLAEVQSLVNEQIRSNHEVVITEMPIDQARKRGAMALFGEKYGDLVRVVEIGPESMELCGGIHVRRSGDIGFMMLERESGISAGVRRIECYSGKPAEAQMLQERWERAQIATLLKGDNSGLIDKVEKLLQRVKTLEKDLDTARAKVASAASGDLVSQTRISPKGIKVIAQQVDNADADTLKSMVDGLRQKLGSGVVILGSSAGDKAMIVAGVTPDLTSGLSAGNLIKEASKFSGGRGGGRADFAQAGGVDASKLSATLDKLFELIA